MPKGSQSSRVCCAAARRAFADRMTVSAAVYGADGAVLTPRERARRPRGASFRTWARQEYGKRAPELLTPKLARIVHGGA